MSTSIRTLSIETRIEKPSSSLFLSSSMAPTADELTGTNQTSRNILWNRQISCLLMAKCQHPKFLCCYASAPDRVKPRVTRINRPLLYNTRGADLKTSREPRETDVNIDSSDCLLGAHDRDAAMRWIFSGAFCRVERRPVHFLLPYLSWNYIGQLNIEIAIRCWYFIQSLKSFLSNMHVSLYRRSESINLLREHLK